MRRPRRIAATAAAAGLALAAVGPHVASAQPAGDVQAGRVKAGACAVCHGPLGLSVTPDAPHLAGQPAIYTAAQLRAYRSGARRHEVMNVMARPLSDEDIAQLAAWYAALRIEVKAPD
jgi:cytochrome c553